ncbi:MAG: glycoside hydrolase [Gammaproteobacteria bacterium]
MAADNKSAKNQVRVVLCWHMHQPEYRGVCGHYQLPWTYLHAIKDYVDMAAILEANPDARAVVNFVPILLEQINDYAHQIKQFLKTGRCLRDPLLAALDMPALPSIPEERIALVKACLKANKERLIDRYPAYQRLAEIADWAIEDTHTMTYLDEQFLVDILVWYHLAWLGETVRRDDTRVEHLIEKGALFNLKDRRQLLGIIGELLESVIPRYRKLAENGQVELSMTPYAHPMLPLLLDFNSAREAMPDVALPESSGYSGGRERVQWHFREGIKSFEHHFGVKPKGCWPSEGGVCEEVIEILDEYGFSWVATGETVLHNSIKKSVEKGGVDPGDCIHTGYRFKENNPVCFFRNDGLSDLIGFTYSDWHGDDAVNNLVHHIENIAESCDWRDDMVVPIILDGENAWESYPENGFHFLTALYKTLADHPKIKLTTFAACVDEGLPTQKLDAIVAGSWVYGTFSTWMGDPDKNRGWDLLCEAKRCFDKIMADKKLSPKLKESLERKLATCEGSDWFWWFGDYNPSESVSDFEHLFRTHLSSLYQMAGLEPPEHLTHIISHGGGNPEQGGVMRPGKEVA